MLTGVPTLDRVLTPLPSSCTAPAACLRLQMTSAAAIHPLRPVTQGRDADPRQPLANIRAWGQGVGLCPTVAVMSWLPLYHDMGPIGATAWQRLSRLSAGVDVAADFARPGTLAVGDPPPPRDGRRGAELCLRSVSGASPTTARRASICHPGGLRPAVPNHQPPPPGAVPRGIRPLRIEAEPRTRSMPRVLGGAHGFLRLGRSGRAQR